MLVRRMLLHHMALVSVRLFCKNLGNLQEFFGQMVYRPPWQKIARTPMCIFIFFHFPDSSPSVLNGLHFYFSLRDSSNRESAGAHD